MEEEREDKIFTSSHLKFDILETFCVLFYAVFMAPPTLKKFKIGSIEKKNNFSALCHNFSKRIFEESALNPRIVHL